MSSEAGTPLVDRIATAVRGVDGVHDLHGGVMGEVATYLPGRKVGGIRLDDDACDVHVVLSWSSPIRETADRVRAAVEPLVEGRVDVTVEDVAGPNEQPAGQDQPDT